MQKMTWAMDSNPAVPTTYSPGSEQQVSAQQFPYNNADFEHVKQIGLFGRYLFTDALKQTQSEDSRHHQA
jgi:hypothetical protein